MTATAARLVCPARSDGSDRPERLEGDRGGRLPDMAGLALAW